jgi:hypothetical protein
MCLPCPTVLPLIFRSLPPESLSVLTPFLVTDTKDYSSKWQEILLAPWNLVAFTTVLYILKQCHVLPWYYFTKDISIRSEYPLLIVCVKNERCFRGTGICMWKRDYNKSYIPSFVRKDECICILHTSCWNMYYIRDTYASNPQKWLIYRRYQRLVSLVGNKMKYSYFVRSLDGAANKPLQRPGDSD